MENKINRLATLFAILFLFVASFHIIVELLPPKVHLYRVLNHQTVINIGDEYDIRDNNRNSVFVQCLDSVEQPLKMIQVEIDEDVYFRLKEEDSVYLYFTPLKLEARAILDQHLPEFYELKNPSDFHYSLQFKYFILPGVVIVLS